MLAIDLYCGLGGWAEGFLAEGYRVVGFDIERHDYGTGVYPGQLVLQDVLTLHGAQFKDAAVIVASPPCTEPSYRAMPWKRAKALNAIGPPAMFISLFNACFRIQREACEAAGHHIPLIVENVKGAQPWVGPARWHFGSYYLWGDVPALMPIPSLRHQKFNPETECRANGCRGENNRFVPDFSDGVKGFTPNSEPLGENTLGKHGSKSKARKKASAEIAKIPFPLALHIAQCFKRKTGLEVD